MTPSQVRSEIDRLITSLLTHQIAIDVGQAIEVHTGNLTIVTWSNETELSRLFDVENTIDEYKITLDERWFSAMLFDGAILQLSYTFNRNTLKKHRLYFFPCPIMFSEQEAQQLTISELLGYLDGSEFRERVRIEGPVRFDFDADAGTLEHPPVHLTISRASSRVPVAYPMSVGHFVRFVFSNFYPDIWNGVKEIREWACNQWPRCLPETQPHRLFVDWRPEETAAWRTGR